MENHNDEWPLSECPGCAERVYLTTTENVRNGKWTILPLDVEPTLNGDFVINLAQYHSAVDILGNNQGDFPVAIYTPGNGEYNPHSPSHYLENEDDGGSELGLLRPQASDARVGSDLPGFEWLGHNFRAGETYLTAGPARIMCHMTVGMGLSRSYVVNHNVPPQLWGNPYTKDRWQTLSLHRAGYALYQPQYGSDDAWTNRHGYTIQIEIVGIPVVNQVTYTDEQNRWIGEELIAPIIKWFRENGIPFDTRLVRQVSNSSGSASVGWHGRMSERESVETGGTVQHIVEWGNDHWDCSTERLDLWVQYALAKLGDTTTPSNFNQTGLDMFLLQHTRRGIWLCGPGYAKGLNPEEYSQVKGIPGIGTFNCGDNERAFDLLYGACTHKDGVTPSTPTMWILNDLKDPVGVKLQWILNDLKNPVGTKLDAIAKAIEDLETLVREHNKHPSAETPPGGLVPPCDA